MAFVPTIGMVVWIPRRGETTATVLGLDVEVGEMWVKPLTGGGKAYPATISDKWAEVRKAQVLEAWFIVAARGWSAAYLTQQAADAAMDANTVAVLHVYPDGTTSIAYPL